MDWLNKIRKWPVEKQRTFTVSLALFLTLLIIIFNSALNIVWKKEKADPIYTENSPINSLQKSFSKIFSTAEPAIDRAVGSTTEIIEQINSASSSLSSTSDIVE